MLLIEVMEHYWYKVVLFCLPLLVGAFVKADEIYLTTAQKAFVSLGLKALLNTTENQEQLKYSLSDLAQELPVLKTEKIIEVKSFGEFLSYQKNEATFAERKLHQLNSADLKVLLAEPQYVGATTSVQNKISQYYLKKIETEKNHLIRGIPKEIGNLFKSEIITTESMHRQALERLDNYTSDLTSQFLTGPISPELLVLTKLLKFYYTALPIQQKAEILYRLMQLPYQATSLEVFLVLLQNSGPQMQKLVQIMGRSSHVPKSLQTIFQKLESQVKSVPWWEVRRIIEAETELSRFSYFEKKALGVGTMAQTHRAQMIDERGRKRNYVVRFLKPDIEKLLEMDHQVLKTITAQIDSDPEIKSLNLPSLERLVDDVHASVVEELELEKTVQQQKIGKTVYRDKKIINYSNQKNELQISVPYAELIGQNKKLMLQELIFGNKPSVATENYAEIYPDLYRTVSERVAEHWLEQAFFKSGFFHADLHQGNMLMQVHDEAIYVHLLDFGMTGVLNQGQRISVLLLNLGLKTNNSELVTESFANLSRFPLVESEKLRLKELIQNRMNNIVAHIENKSSLEDWTAWMMQQGLELQYDFIKLNRGIMAIKGLLADSGSLLNLEALGDKIVLRNKTSLLSIIHNEPHIKYMDLFRLGYQKVTNHSLGKKELSLLRCESLF